MIPAYANVDFHDALRLGDLSWIQEFEKAASIVNQEHPDRAVPPMEKCAESEYAYRDHGTKKFWCGTKEATLLSMMTFVRNVKKIDPADRIKIASELNTFARRFGISFELPKFVADKKVISREDLGDEDFALIRKTASGTRERLYPIPNAEFVKRAMDYFDLHWHAFTPLERFAYSTAIARKVTALNKEASEKGTDRTQITSANILRYIGDVYSPLLGVKIASRIVEMNRIKNADLAERYRRLLSERDQLPPHEFAGILSELDKKAGLDRLWDTGVDDPYASTLGTREIETPSVKTASGSISEDSVREAVRLAMNAESVKSYFSKEAIADLEKDPVNAFRGLATEQQDLIMSVMPR